MKTILYLAGIVMIVAGIAVGVISQMDTGTVLIGLNLGLAAVLLTGGFIVLGLSAVVDALSGISAPQYGHQPRAAGAADKVTGFIPGAGGAVAAGGATAAGAAALVNKTGDAVDAAASKAGDAIDKAGKAAAETRKQVLDSVTREKEESKKPDVPPLRDETAKDTSAGHDTDGGDQTIAADKTEAPAQSDDKAKDEAQPQAPDLDDRALDSSVDDTGKTDTEKTEKTDADADASQEADAQEGEEQLYIVEEKTMFGKQARVLSDGTIEAETAEGWMRFENEEHLEEYLDAMEPGSRG